MNRRIISIGLLLGAILPIAGCGGGSDKDQPDTDDSVVKPKVTSIDVVRPVFRTYDDKISVSGSLGFVKNEDAHHFRLNWENRRSGDTGSELVYVFSSCSTTWVPSLVFNIPAPVTSCAREDDWSIEIPLVPVLNLPNQQNHGQRNNG